MGLTRFEIIFNKPDKNYNPGDTVVGQVIIDLNSVKRLHGISIKFKGRTKTEWSKGSGKNRRTYNGLEKYFENTWYLVRPTSENNSTTELQPGKHIFDYSFNLPVALPSSFTTKSGTVKYAVKVVIERNWKFNQIEKKEFFVSSYIDLNQLQIVKEPATLTMEREFFISGTIKTRVLFPCTGYICGQIVPFIIEICNSSSVSVQHVILKLTKYIIAFTTDKKRNDALKEELLTKTINFRVKKRTTLSHFDSFTVPNTMPLYNLENCNILNQEFKLKFSLLLSGFHPDAVGKIPVKVGHVPLQYITPIEQLRFNVSLN